MYTRIIELDRGQYMLRVNKRDDPHRPFGILQTVSTRNVFGYPELERCQYLAHYKTAKTALHALERRVQRVIDWAKDNGSYVDDWAI